MFITRSSGLSYASKTSLIPQWKERSISFGKPGDTGCFAIVAQLFDKAILRKIDWHHEKSKFKVLPFSFRKVRSLSKTIPLPIAMAQCCSWLHNRLASYFLSSAELYYLTRTEEGFSRHYSFLEVLWVLHFQLWLLYSSWQFLLLLTWERQISLLQVLPHGQYPIWRFLLPESSHNYHSVAFSSLAVVHLCSTTVFEPHFLQPLLVH